MSDMTYDSNENPLLFQGTIKKMKMISNNICYGPPPESDTEVEQRITVNCEGRVWFTGYNFGNFCEGYEKARVRNYKIDKAAAEKMLNTIAGYFSSQHDDFFVTDSGNWEMELTNTDDVTYQFKGSLCGLFDDEGDLSDLVRDTLGMFDLFVFDGRNRINRINKISIDYYEKIKETEFTQSDYYEQLIIDRKSKTLEHIQNKEKCYQVSCKYAMDDGIEDLLEDFETDHFLETIEGYNEDVIESDEVKDYKIIIEYQNKPSRVILGSYDKYGLPDDYADFIEKIAEFIQNYETGELFNPLNYRKAKRCKSDYIYCSVKFNGRSKSYYYLSDDDDIKIGDYVIVPVGYDNYQCIAEVVNIEYFNEKDVPLSLDKTKHIIHKCTTEDFEKSLYSDM